MGFHTRQVDEKILKSSWERDGVDGILHLYDAEAINSGDSFSMRVTDLFDNRISRAELIHQINLIFDHVN